VFTRGRGDCHQGGAPAGPAGLGSAGRSRAGLTLARRLG